jgi:hypothetical protein
MNAKMGPVVRVPWSRRLVATKPLSAARSVKPDREPGAAWLVVENNRIAQRSVEWALTIRPGKTIKAQTAVGRDRCTGDVDGVGVPASRVVVCDNNLVWVIRVSRSERLGLSDVRRGLGMVDQIDVRSAIRQRSHQPVAKLREGAVRGTRTSVRGTARDHNRPGSHVLLFIDVELLDPGTIKHRRDERVHRLGNDLVVYGGLSIARSGCGEHARA